MSASVAALSAFNLICTGVSFVGDGINAVKKENQAPYSEIFRIDLSSGRWCSGKCDSTAPIYDVSETQITLKYEKDIEIGSTVFILLNRESGSIIDRNELVGYYFVLRTGKCVRSSFTGFPDRKF